MERERVYYLDWLRILVVLLLIPHHTALTFSHIGNGYIYTDQVVDSLYYSIQSEFLNLWFMKLLFFISGISSYMALKKRSALEYLKERFSKLIIPTLFVTLFLGPLTAYTMAYYRGYISGSLFQFYPTYLLNIRKYLGWAQMWFCVYLFVFSILLLPLFRHMIKRQEKFRWISFFIRFRYNYLFPMLLIIFWEVLLRPFYPGYQNLINDWANFTVYLSFFFFGFFSGQNKDVLTELKNKFKLSGIIAAFSTVLYIYIQHRGLNHYFLNSITLLLSLFGAVAAYTWVMFFIGIGNKYFNRTAALLPYLSRSSFALYIFHYLIITIINIFLIRTSLNHYIIFLMTCIFTYLLFFIFFELIIKKVKILRYICGLKNEKSRQIIDRQTLH